MILQSSANPVQTSGLASTQQFTIKASAKAFSILSSSLYKNPTLAIVRELSCNAYDAHVSAGTVGTPFEIHAPNSLEPWFHIRDYGTGLSEKQLTTIYTTYFESTKTDSNDYVGALGLGSKSPFSYAESFTVTSFYNGTEYNYVTFVDSAGFPTMSPLGNAPTTEPNGLKIKFAVRSPDIYRFHTAIENFFKTWVTIPPIIVGAAVGELSIRSIKKGALEGENWFVCSDSALISNAIVIQGNVPYPLAFQTIKQHEAFAQLSDVAQARITKLCSLPLVLQFPIGVLDFAASREELQYTAQTVKTILHKLLVVAEEIGKSYVDTLLCIENMWELCFTASEMRQRHGILFSSAVVDNNTTHERFNKTIHELTSVKHLVVPATEFKAIADKANFQYNNGKAFHTVNVVSTPIELVPHRQVRVVIEDDSKKFVTKLRNYMRSYGRSSVRDIYVLRKHKHNKNTNEVMEAKQLLSKVLDVPESVFLYASKMECPVKLTPVKKKQPTGVWVRLAKCDNITTFSPAVDISTLPTTETFYYTFINGHRLVDPTSGTQTDFDGYEINQLGAALVNPSNIYGVRAADVKKLPKNWIPLNEYLGNWCVTTGVANYEAMSKYHMLMGTEFDHRGLLVAASLDGSIQTTYDSTLNRFISDIVKFKKSWVSSSNRGIHAAPHVMQHILHRYANAISNTQQQEAVTKAKNAVKEAQSSAKCWIIDLLALLTTIHERHIVFDLIARGYYATHIRFSNMWKLKANNHSSTLAYKTAVCETNNILNTKKEAFQ